MKPVLLRVFHCVCVALLLIHFQPVALFAGGTEKMMTIGTGNITGVYYSAGSAVAKMHNKKRAEYGVWLVNQATEGSLENVEDVLEKDFDFGIAQANVLYQAAHGHELWDNVPQEALRSVLGLYTEDITLIAAVDAGIETPQDLKGKRVNIGAPGSSDQQTSGLILEALGLNTETDLQLFQDPTYIASEKIQSNQIDAYFYTVGHPNLSIIEATAGQRKIRIVPFDQGSIEIATKSRPYLSAEKIDIEYYDNLENDAPVPTIGLKAILFTRTDVDEEVVYRIVKEVVDNLDLFRRQHPAFATLTPEKMVKGLIVPLHPGAERYFRETGTLQ